MASVLTFLIVVLGTGRTIQALQDEVKQEKKLREEAVEKEKELREKDAKHEKELREEAVKRAEAQVDKRFLDLIFAAEYESLRSKVDNVNTKVIRDMQQAVNELKKPADVMSPRDEGASGDGR